MFRSLSHRSAGVLVLAGLWLALGCGRVETDEPPATPSPTDGEEDAPEEVDEVRHDLECLEGLGEPRLMQSLELPASIAAEARHHDHLLSAAEELTGEPVVLEVAVPLALGTEAPSAVRLKLGSVLYLDCGEPEGEFTIDSIEVLEGDAQVILTEEPSVVAVEVEQAGDSLAEVSGVLRGAGGGDCGEDPLELPLVYSLLVHAEEFEWSVEPTGECPPAVSSGLPLPVVVRARDAAGQIVSPRNIQEPALSVSTSEGVELKARGESTDSLSSVVPVGAGTVTVALADGSSTLDLRVLAPEELNDVYLDYWLTGIVARGDLPLDDGGSYEFIGEHPKLEVRARWVAHEGTWLCGAPDAGHFWITSLTPDVCPVESRNCRLEDDIIGTLLYESIPIIANGTCTLQIDAPDFAGGSGASEQFSVDLTNPDLTAD